MSRAVVLCVDDEGIVLRSLREQLRRQFTSLEIETAESGEEALDVFRDLVERGVDVPVVISDQIMPGMAGDELLAAIHALDPRTLTILLTGQASADAVGRAVNAARLYRFIPKPWDEPDLALTLRAAVKAWDVERELARQHEGLRAAHDAARRFVPDGFLKILGRENLVDVEQADHAARNLSIFFSDIRHFTTIVEGKGPKESFAFINEYARAMEPPLRAHGGFIDSIEGDAIMALFDGSADSAVRAGIDSLKALATLNELRASRGERLLEIGVGLNTGTVILGVIGSERIKCGVIGDPVNIAARVEGMTKQYDAPMLVTEATRDALVSPDAYEMRLLDRVRVKGKSTPVTVYEVLDGLPESERARKLSSRATLEAAREAFAAGDLFAAIDAFRGVLDRDPREKVAALYVKRCEQLIAAGGVPEGWDGVVDLREK